MAKRNIYSVADDGPYYSGGNINLVRENGIELTRKDLTGEEPPGLLVGFHIINEENRDVICPNGRKS